MVLELTPKLIEREGEQVSKMMSIAELGTEEVEQFMPSVHCLPSREVHRCNDQSLKSKVTNVYYNSLCKSFGSDGGAK
jgi:spore cortex formation protein SpoVR/YcgB (stage V sporulation)